MNTTIGNRYEIQEEIGKGRVSTMYRALDSETGATVALKIFSRQAVPGPKSLEHLEKEISKRQELKHSNIVEILDRGVHLDEFGFETVYMVLEHLEGTTLRKRIALLEHDGLNLGEILNILLQVTEALEFLHQKDIAIKTLEPKRLILDGDSNVKLPAFGYLTTQQWSLDVERLSQVVIPNFCYVAPESLVHKLTMEGDVKSDIYLFGILAFELACGTVPFEADQEMTRKLQQNEPLPKTLLKVGLPAWFDELVRSCMDKSPENRPSISKVKEAIEKRLKENSAELEIKPKLAGGNDVHVLFIEDNKLDQLSFARFAKREPLAFNFVVAQTVKEAKNAMGLRSFDVIVSDYMLPDGTGLDIIAEAGETPVIMVTGAGREDVAAAALKAGAYDYISKDVRHGYLKAIPHAVARAHKHQQAEKKSAAIDTARNLIDKLSDNLSKTVSSSQDAQKNLEDKDELVKHLTELESLCVESAQIAREELAVLFSSLEQLEKTCEDKEDNQVHQGG